MSHLLRQRMPTRDPMIEPDSGLISRTWRIFLRDRSDVVDATPVRVGEVDLTGQAAAIAATPVPAELSAGLYRVMVYAHRTVVAATSSSLGVTIGWRDGGITRTATTGVDTSNTLGAVLQGVWLVRIDPNSFITYEVTYASVAAAQMIYALDVVVERVQA